jgi:transcriptional regulator with GAF, ATPase, and Fis domain
MRQLNEEITRVAQSNHPVLITGESGSGKTTIAHIIHQRSPRTQGNLVDVNCAALPEALIESELFGFERGAFTSATILSC